MKKFFSAAFFFFSIKILIASHIVGGEMYYHYLGNNQYRITLVVYRDCINGQAPYDPEASLGIFDSQGNLYQNVLVPINDSSYVPNAINSPCLTPPMGICDQVAHYYTTVTLPPTAGGYTIAYQRCCRNYSCVNISQFTGATYTAEIPDQLYAVDDNPIYQNLPPTFICAGAPFTFDHSATDADGDSLVYSMYTPYDGADENVPKPSPPSEPPYAPIHFTPPYTLSNVMGGVPMTINANSGVLTATPSTIGQFVYGILVKEYRNGVLIGETRRDFQVNVTMCENYTIASLAPTIVCGSLNAVFQNNSYGASTYSWNFGDLTTTNDVSTVEDPNYIYPDTGHYSVMLIAYAANTNCNDTAWADAYIYPAFFAQAGTTLQDCRRDFQFIDSSFVLNSNATHWMWNFGDNNSSNTTNPFHHFSVPGNYIVTMIAYADSGCPDTATIMVDVDPIPECLFSASLDTCTQTVEFYNASTESDIYDWDFGDNTSGTEAHPFHVYHQDGTFTVYMIASNDSGCSDSAQVTLDIPKVPIANFSWNLANCDSVANFQNLSTNSTGYSWTFGDNGSSSSFTSPSHLYEHSGNYTVTLHASASTSSCIAEMQQTIQVNRRPLADFVLALDTCSFMVSIDNYTADATLYHWVFSDGYTDQSENPVHYFPSDGNVSVTLTAENDVGCTHNAIQNALIPPLPVSDFTWTHVDCDSLVTFRQQSLNSISYRWFFGDGETNDDPEAEHIYHMAGDIPVKLVSTSQHGCKDTTSENIYIIIQTPAEFTAFMDSCSGVVQFTNRSPIAVLYDWNFGDQTASTEENPSHQYPVNASDYIVTLTVNKASACQEHIQKKLRYEVNEGEIVYAPNSFTPNGDGLNDRFELSLWKPCDIYKLSIFDRWGHPVYQNDDANASSWDGTIDGHLVPEGVYVFLLEGSSLKKTGYVLLIR